MLDFKLRTKFSDHSIVEIGCVTSDDPSRDAIPANKVILDKSGYHSLSD